MTDTAITARMCNQSSYGDDGRWCRPARGALNYVSCIVRLFCFVRRGVAWRGVAWCGVAWHGVAWRRKDQELSDNCTWREFERESAWSDDGDDGACVNRRIHGDYGTLPKRHAQPSVVRSLIKSPATTVSHHVLYSSAGSTKN